MTDNSKLAQQLVKAYAGTSSTEELILYVAGTDNMLALCSILLEQHDLDGSSPLIREVEAYCRTKGVHAGGLFAEVRKILLALNKYHDSGGDHYAVLGLQPNATGKEVKKAFRKLSKKHHPDTRENQEEDAQRFMEITGAYHAIMAAGDAIKKSATPWRRKHAHLRTRRLRDQKMFLTLILVLISLMILASIYISGRHKRAILLHRLRPNTVPPAQSAESSDRKSPALAVVQPEVKETKDNGQAMQADVPESLTKNGEPSGKVSLKTTHAVPGILPPAQTGIAQKEVREKSTETDQDIRVALAPLPDLPEPRQADVPVHERQSPAGEDSSRQNSFREKQLASVPLPGEQLREKQAKISRINSSLEISALINKYSTLYSARRLPSFLSIFADNAKENGHQLTSDKYKSLFAHTRTIDLNIADINWNRHLAGYLAEGTFTASFAFTDGNTTHHQGNITFYMIKEHDQLKIKSLDYTFDD